jgi:hypothetical protein
MNKLANIKRSIVLVAFIEEESINSVVRMTGVAKPHDSQIATGLSV